MSLVENIDDIGFQYIPVGFQDSCVYDIYRLLIDNDVKILIDEYKFIKLERRNNLIWGDSKISVYTINNRESKLYDDTDSNRYLYDDFLDKFEDIINKYSVRIFVHFVNKNYIVYLSIKDSEYELYRISKDDRQCKYIDSDIFVDIIENKLELTLEQDSDSIEDLLFELWSEDI